jgi:hypothetical protein
MRYNQFKKSIIYFVILIFISINIIPLIDGNIQKNDYTLNIIEPNICPMSSNVLLAYWSFDEGSGSIAHDYSGHDYDGLIHGADWTTGYSGYALDFDGNSDYVSVDTHSQDLGFNKSDDYKISVWINSTSTDPGMIYQISSDIYILPIAYIRLNSDGTLEAKVKSSETCGVEVYSIDSYNDGLWHYIEFVYHGDSYPTLELYVDDEFIGNNTDWLCHMNSDQFKRAKIGMTSYDSTECFYGIIDEVTVFKNPQGNQPPNAPTIDGPTTGTVGEEYSYTFVTTDPDGEYVNYWVDWGDGNNTGWIGPYSSNEEVNLSYTWSENGAYEIKTKAKDIFHDESELSTLLVAMGNIPPDKPTITGPTSGKKGEKIEYTFVTTDLNGHDIKYYIDWGDGNNSGWTDYYTSGEEVTISHTWDKKGTFIIEAKAKDIYDAESDWSELFLVTITQKAFLVGFITNMSSNGEFTTFHTKLLLYIGLNPFESKFYSSGEEILISNEYSGRISEKFIIGIFNAIIV